jgi:hypothetical protein
MSDTVLPTSDASALDGPPMPEMRQGMLSNGDLKELCADLTQLAHILSIQTRARGNTNAETRSSSLDDALQELWDGKLHAVQIRYAYDSHEWTDTLMRADGHVRVIRCQHPTL